MPPWRLDPLLLKCGLAPRMLRRLPPASSPVLLRSSGLLRVTLSQLGCSSVCACMHLTVPCACHSLRWVFDSSCSPLLVRSDATDAAPAQRLCSSALPARERPSPCWWDRPSPKERGPSLLAVAFSFQLVPRRFSAPRPSLLALPLRGQWLPAAGVWGLDSWSSLETATSCT